MKTISVEMIHASGMCLQSPRISRGRRIYSAARAERSINPQNFFVSAANFSLDGGPAKMALYQRAPYQTADAQQVIVDESDQEEDALVNDYQEQVHFDDGMGDLDRTPSMGGGGQLHDMQAQLAAAATPLEYQATLETKFASYDSYCNLFHYILNSEGPVDLEVPSVSIALPPIIAKTYSRLHV